MSNKDRNIVIGLASTIIILLVITSILMIIVLVKNSKMSNDTSKLQQPIRRSVPPNIKRLQLPLSKPLPKFVRKSPIVKIHYCETNNDCGENESCDISRLWKIKEFDGESWTGESFPLKIDTCENMGLSILDIAEIGTKQVISTDSQVFIFKNNRDERVVKTNIVAHDLAVADTKLLARSSDGFVYSYPIEKLNDDVWLFMRELNYGSNITHLDASKDRRSVIVSDPSQTKLYVDQVFVKAVKHNGQVFIGNDLEQVAIVENNTCTVFPEGETFDSVSFGIFDSNGTFHGIRSENEQEWRRVKMIDDEPVFLSFRTCERKPKQVV